VTVVNLPCDGGRTGQSIRDAASSQSLGRINEATALDLCRGVLAGGVRGTADSASAAGATAIGFAAARAHTATARTLSATAVGEC